ncbi:MAG: PqqD family protein [Candidatus Acidiferrales bacterium]
MTACPVPNPQLAWREIDGEIVIISPEDSQVHELNVTAALVWKSANAQQTVEEIAAGLAAEFDVPLESALKDVAELIALLTDKQLLLVAVAAKG